MKKECVLYDRECINCGECDVCDLDPKKKCDNCGVCLEMDDDYKTFDVDLTINENDEPELLSYEELFPEKAFIGEKHDVEDDEFVDEDFEETLDDCFIDEDSFEEDYDDDNLGFEFGDFFGKG